MFSRQKCHQSRSVLLGVTVFLVVFSAIGTDELAVGAADAQVGVWTCPEERTRREGGYLTCVPADPPKPKSDEEVVTRTARVKYETSLAREEGYERASIGVRYKIINCGGEIHIAYSLDPKSVQTDGSYWYHGRRFSGTGKPPQPATIHFVGDVVANGMIVGKFDDKIAGESLGFGCFTGQTQKVAMLRDHVGAKASKEDVRAVLNRWTAEPRQMDIALTDASGRTVASEEIRAETEREKAKERARVDAANAEAVAATKAQTDRILADQKRHAADVEQFRVQQEKYELDRERYARDAAAAAEAKRQHDVEMEAYREATRPRR